MQPDPWQIHPPVHLPVSWWLVVAGCVLTALGVLTLSILRFKRLGLPPVVPDDSLDQLRNDALAAIRQATEAQIEGHRACQRIIRAARSFVGSASAGLANHMSLRQLQLAARRDPRLDPLVALVESTLETCYSRATPDDVAAAARQAEKVIHAWR